MGVLSRAVWTVIILLIVKWCMVQVIGLSAEPRRINVRMSSGHLNKGTIDRKNYLGKYSSSQILLPFDKKKTETGIEFLRHHDLDMDDDYIFGTEPVKKDRRNKMSTWVLVQKLIRAVKGFPNELKPEREDRLLTGLNFANKPEWCFETFNLRQLVKVELIIYSILKQFDEDNKLERFPALDSYFEDIEHSTMKVNLKKAPAPGIITDVHEDPYLYVTSHPILVYRLIRRFAMDLQPILKRLNDNIELMVALYQYANPEELVFPNRTDLIHALQVVKNSQYENMMDISEYARGKFGHVKTGIQLNALHAIEIGTYYLQHSVYDGAVQWMYYALETVKQSRQLFYYPLIKQCFTDLLNIAIESHNTNFLSKKKAQKVWWEHDIFNTTITRPFIPKMYVPMVQLLKPHATRMKYVAIWNWAVLVNFKRVCAGENLQSEAEKAELKCYSDTARHAYFRINPLKVEFLNKEPPVVQIYDFIGRKLRKIIKAHSVPHLKRSQVFPAYTVADNVTMGPKKDLRRTSSSTWFSDHGQMGKYVRPFTKKLEYMSGLTISHIAASEDYQVARYGPSHFYEVHHDGYSDERRCIEYGNRITTIMAYLSGVAVGGRTGFPIYGFAAKPIKGSILMWNNLLRNGVERDPSALHGACPVALGVKWITTKWILNNENMLTYPCTLHANK